LGLPPEVPPDDVAWLVEPSGATGPVPLPHATTPAVASAHAVITSRRVDVFMSPLPPRRVPPVVSNGHTDASGGLNASAATTYIPVTLVGRSCVISVWYVESRDRDRAWTGHRPHSEVLTTYPNLPQQRSAPPLRVRPPASARARCFGLPARAACSSRISSRPRRTSPGNAR